MSEPTIDQVHEKMEAFFADKEVLHSNIGGPSVEQILDAVQRDNNIGLCMECGAEQEGVEPDAENYECDECWQKAVCGADILLISL
jgi:hypothetical protein|tara:strand:- start:108 stop:365 length:258 start_codon:yes stop_codon:yes gene_type:complete